jgi:hypothetical protein
MFKYTNKEKVEGYIGRALTAQEQARLDGLVLLVGRAIYSYTNRIWWDIGVATAPAAEARYFDSLGQRELLIDDFTILEKVELLDSEGSTNYTIDDATRYVLNPRNNPVKESIYLRDYRYPYAEGRVKVTASWGAGVVPEDVVDVATQIVSGYITNGFSSEENSAEMKKESIEGYSYERYDKSVNISSTQESLFTNLDSYKRYIL